MTGPQSSLARIQAPNPMDPAELRDFAWMIWHQCGVPVFLNIGEIPLDQGRQAVIDAAVRLYGERTNGGGQGA